MFTARYVLFGLLVGCSAGGGGTTPSGDSGPPPSNANVEACEGFVDTFNALPCVEAETMLEAADFCRLYESRTSVDCTNIFDCYADNLVCQSVGEPGPNDYSFGCPTACED